MGLFAIPAVGSLLKDKAPKVADPIKKKVPGEKPAAREKGNKTADTTEAVQANEE